MLQIDKISHSDCFFCSRFLCVKENGEGGLFAIKERGIPSYAMPLLLHFTSSQAILLFIAAGKLQSQYENDIYFIFYVLLWWTK